MRAVYRRTSPDHAHHVNSDDADHHDDYDQPCSHSGAHSAPKARTTEDRREHNRPQQHLVHQQIRCATIIKKCPITLTTMMQNPIAVNALI